jgi:hypothetical protein
MTATPSPHTIREWYGTMYRNAPGVIAVVTLPSGSARFFRTDQLDDATRYTARRATQTNVYAGCCTLAIRPGLGRGCAADTLALPGVWCDLNVLGPWHKLADSQRTLPLPRRDQALALLDDLGLAPTAILATGGGYQAWWLFGEPLVFATDADRGSAALLSARFGTALVQLGQHRGWHVDNTNDLGRVLRPAGTVNRKRAPVAVTVIECHPERRYRPADIEGVWTVPGSRPMPPRSLKTPPRDDGRDSPAEVFA